MNLFDRRLLIVTGKGGVGKTTVCAALGALAVRQGLRTLIAETSGTRQLPDLWGVRSKGYKPVELRPDLYTLSITPEEAIEEFVVQQIHVRSLYRAVFQNRVMGPFVEAVPGLHDAVQMGKVFDLTRSRAARRPEKRPDWDLVILDAPATGHGISMLHAPRSMMELTRGGPLFESNRIVQELLDDPARTALLLVALPEEMPVRETADLWQRLGEDRSKVRCCVLNGIYPTPLVSRAELEAAAPCLHDTADPAVFEALDLARAWDDRIERERAAATELREAVPLPLIELPLLLSRRIGAPEIDRLANELGRGLLEAG